MNENKKITLEMFLKFTCPHCKTTDTYDHYIVDTDVVCYHCNKDFKVNLIAEKIKIETEKL